MTTVKHLLTHKTDQVWSVVPETSLKDTLKFMFDHDIGVVVVVENGKVVGIFSERDFARAVARDPSLSLDTPVKKLMTGQVYFVKPDQFIEDCMALMTEKNIRHLPVMQNNQLVGMVSMRDVVREIVSEKDITIQSLENYIMGREFS